MGSDEIADTQLFEQRRISPFTPSLRAHRSNPWLGIARSKMDCFVASAPRNDETVNCFPRHCERQRSNPWLGIARSKMDCFVASAPRNDETVNFFPRHCERSEAIHGSASPDRR